jgi:hypothetical protein
MAIAEEVVVVGQRFGDRRRGHVASGPFDVTDLVTGRRETAALEGSPSRARLRGRTAIVGRAPGLQYATWLAGTEPATRYSAAMVVPKDTSPDAWARHLSGVRAMTPQDRLRLAAAMSDEIRALARDGIRSRHPDWTAAQVEAGLEDLLLGAPIARAVRAARSAADS